MKRVGRVRRSVLADRVVAAEYRLDRRVGLDRSRSTIGYRTRSPSRCRPNSVARTAPTIAASHTLERQALRPYRDIYATIDSA